MESAAEVVITEARRSLDHQQAALDQARGRAGLVFTVAGVTSSFLAGPALRGHHGLPALAALAIGLWAAAALAAMAVLLPWRYKFTVHPQVLLGPGWGSLDADEMSQQLAFVMGRNLDSNTRQLRWLWRAVLTAMVLTAASIAVWISLLAKGP